MFWRKKKQSLLPDKYEFWTTVPGLETLYPVTPISDLTIPWISNSRQYIQGRVKALGTLDKSAAHLCSGIKGATSYGWIVQSCFDLLIETNGDGCTFKWILPEMVCHYIPGELVGSFDNQIFGNFVELPPQSLKTIVKINSPWRFSAPAGKGLMYVPLQYHNENRFTSTVGYLDPKIGNQLNAVLFWHVLNGTTLIKAGTPLFQIIPIDLEMPGFEVRRASEKELEYTKVRDIVLTNTFTTNTKKIYEVYDNYFLKKDREN